MENTNQLNIEGNLVSLQDFNPPSMTRRLLAHIFDSTLILIITALIYVFIIALTQVSGLSELNTALFIIVYVSVDFFIRVIVAIVTNGKTLGKALFNMKIVKVNNTHLSFKDLFVRWIIFEILIQFGLIGIIILYWSTNKPPQQGLHDSASNTLVIKSPTSILKKSIIIFGYLLPLIAIICLFIIGSNTLTNTSKQQAAEIQNESVTATSLSGVNGPLAESGSVSSDVIEYTDAQQFMALDDIEKAKEKIDIAATKSPMALNIMEYRCFVYTQDDDYKTAYNLCMNLYKNHPNNPSALVNLIVDLYHLDKCDDIELYAKKLVDLRIGSSYSDESKSNIYASAGIVLSLCKKDPENAQLFLKGAIELTTDSKYIQIYQQYLDFYSPKAS